MCPLLLLCFLLTLFSLSLLSPSSHSPTLEHNSWEYCLSIDARTAGGTLFAGWGSCQVYVSVSSIGHFFLKRRERGGKNKFTSFLLCHAINDWTSNCHRARTAINCAHQGCAGGSQGIAAVRKTSTIRDINMYICILWSMIARNKNTQTKAASLYRFLLSTSKVATVLEHSMQSMVAAQSERLFYFLLKMVFF